MKTILVNAIVPIYGPRLNVTMIVADDIQPLIKKYCPENEQDSQIDANSVAMRILNWPDGYLLFSRDWLSHGNIAHEIDHMTHKIMREIGMGESEESEEAYTHLNGWFANWIYDALRRGRVRI